MDLSDQELVQRWCTRQDTHSFQAIVQRHAAMVYHTALRVLKNQADAEDVAQECFETLAKTHEAKSIKFLAGWLHGVSTNLALKHIRTSSRRREREHHYSDAQDKQIESTEWEEIYPIIDEAILALDEPHRAPIIAHFMEGQSHAYIAQELRVSRSTISNRINQALTLIESSLKRKGVVSSIALGTLLIDQLASAASIPPSLTGELNTLSLAQGQGATGVLGSGMGMGTVLKVAAVLLVTGAAVWGLWGGDTEEVSPTNVVVEEATLEVESAVDKMPYESISRPERIPRKTIVIGEKSGGEIVRPYKVGESEPEEVHAPVIGRFVGKVVNDDGEAVAGASLNANGNGGMGSATSNEDGSFTIEVHEVEMRNDNTGESETSLFRISASKQPYNNTVKMRVPLDSTDLKIVLKTTGEIRGFVIDAESGEAIKDFKARIVRERSPVEGMMGSGRPWTTFSDEEGEFVLPTRYDVGQMAVLAKGFIEEKLNILVPEGEVYEDVFVTLRQGSDITGYVVDAITNEPVQGAKLSVVNDNIAQWWGDSEGNFTVYATSDEEGYFSISGVDQELLVDIMAWHNGYAQAFIIDHDPRIQGDIEMKLSPGGELKGTVLREGKPVSALRIWVGNAFGREIERGSASPGAPSFLALSYTTEEGLYHFTKMPYGRYQLRVMNVQSGTPVEGRYLTRHWVDIEEGEVTILDFNLEAESVVQGYIVGVEDTSVLQLQLCDQRYPEQSLYTTLERHDSSKPDEEGFFRFPPVPPGDYFVRAVLQGEKTIILEESFSLGEAEQVDIVVDFTEHLEVQPINEVTEE